ncbi:MAG TPA: transglycosylase family protein [Kineosporiaceae bacterium]
MLRVVTVQLRGRLARLAAQASVLASVVGGTIAYAHGEGILVAAGPPSRPDHLAARQVASTAVKLVTLVADGRTRDVTTTVATVADLLAEQKVAVGPADQLTALPTSPVFDGLVVALTRIERRRVTVTETVSPPVVQRPSAVLAPGARRVLRPGRPGTQHTVYEVVLADGRPTSRTELVAVVVRPPMPQIVQVGGPRRPSARPLPGVDGLNWTALARCESGGNPRAVNPAGYYGLFQFSVGTWRAVGGSGLPNDAPPAEQLYRAKLLFQRGGAGQWGCGRHLYD